MLIRKLLILFIVFILFLFVFLYSGIFSFSKIESNDVQVEEYLSKKNINSFFLNKKNVTNNLKNKFNYIERVDFNKNKSTLTLNVIYKGIFARKELSKNIYLLHSGEEVYIKNYQKVMPIIDLKVIDLIPTLDSNLLKFIKNLNIYSDSYITINYPNLIINNSGTEYILPTTEKYNLVYIENINKLILDYNDYRKIYIYNNKIVPIN